MLNIAEHVSLLSLNTLAIDASARYFIEIHHQQQIPEALAFAEQNNVPVFVLGGGSNIVLTQDFPGLVMQMALKGITVEDEVNASDNVIVTAAAGENWHYLVEHCLQQELNGLENLALIPGSVGAAPIQNIGAYGVELTDVFVSLTGWDCEKQCWRQMDKASCEFGYRDSIFKQQLKGRFIITAVSLRLHRHNNTQIHYAVLKSALAEKGIENPAPQQVADTVIAIRQSKLPDPTTLANVGSFFKNPIVDAGQAKQLLAQFPAMAHYPQADGSVKLAAGWLLEQAGWKGKRQGAVGMHDQQSLVLINYQQASGAEVLALAKNIQADIKRTFNVQLEIEPALLPAMP